MDYVDLPAPSGQEDNVGGTTQVVSFARLADFLTIEKPSTLAAALTIADYVKITADHVFKTGKMFLKAYTTEDKGMLDYAPQGDQDGKSLKPTLKFFYPGSSEAVLGFIGAGKNDAFIFMVTLADGLVHQVGSEQFPARLTGNWTSATNSSGVRGAEIEVTCALQSSPVIYAGTISYTPAV